MWLVFASIDRLPVATFVAALAETQSRPAVCPNMKATFAQSTPGATYNNAIPALQKNPFRFRFAVFGAEKTVAVTQRPEYGIAGIVWDCGAVLCAYLAATPAKWHGRTFLELGAGTGVASAVAWHCGAAAAVASDLPAVVDDVTRPTLQQCASDAKGGNKKALVAHAVSWGVAEDAAAVRALLRTAPHEALPLFDYVVAADVSYRPNEYVPLLRTITALVPPDGDGRASMAALLDVGDGDDAPDAPDTPAPAAPCATVVLFVYRRRVTADVDMLAYLRACYVEVGAVPGRAVEPAYPKDDLTLFEFRTHGGVARLAAAKAPAAAAAQRGKKSKR
jgi:predicted nicotinamide N-methyase